MADKKWTVDFEVDVEAQLRDDFKRKKISTGDIQIIKRWTNEVETQGLKVAQRNKDWRDHELTRGKWIGHRAISFSFSGRDIYRVEEGRLIVIVVRVTAEHNYE